MQRLLFGGLASAGILILVLGILFLVPRWFLSSDSFRNVLMEETRSRTGFEGEWMPFRLEGWKLASSGFEGIRLLDEARIHMRIEEIHVQLNWRGLLSRTWDIELIKADRVAVEVVPLSRKPDDPPEPSDLSASGSHSPLAFLIPREVRLSSLVVEDGQLRLGGATDQPITISGIHIKGTPALPNSVAHWSFALSGGKLIFPDRPSWSLNSGRLRFSDKEWVLVDSEWLGANAGILRLEGPLTRQSTLHADLELEGVGVPLKSVVPTRWQSFVRGNLDGEARITAANGLLEVKGTADGNGVTLVGVPALLAMQHATGIARWTELPMETAFTEFQYRQEKLDFTQLILESEDLVRLEGNLTAGPDRQLEGLFQVGLAPRAVSKIPGAATAVFSLEQNGYQWAQPPMKVSGTTAQPEEDLSPRLKGAVIEAVEEKVKEKIEQGADLLDSLLQQIR